ncbi:menaquinone biosynthesis decarboxylase [Vallitalea okinawensis]|uniref:menaquinone biosynthesis decarboxylase n=1 Tax=Vallitalea okinawensis TaxID=2078660 RepID=UPI000CFB9103|nr:menaquinone biosynthesis decarboxylase [Vallitalea okinawensis]
MAYKDLQHFMEKLKKKELLDEIDAEVDSYLEITEIADRVSKDYGHALLFNNVKGSPYPVLINTMGTYERMNMSLGVDSLDDIAHRIADLMDISNYITLTDKIKSIPKLYPLIKVFPKKVKTGPCQEVIEEPDLNQLPVLQCWPRDGGRYITLPLVFTKDPETGQQNIGMYRMQVYDHKTTGMHWHLHKDGREIYQKYRQLGKKMPVSVALGCDPATIYAATSPLPKMIDEMLFAGFLRKDPVKMVKCITNDLYVPAHAEFILEGYVDLDERRMEGPFGDHTGYYSLEDMYPVFHLEKITHKKKPVYPTTIVGKPPMEDCYMGKATERIFLPLIKMFCPEIIDMNFPLEGVFHNCVIVSIKKKYPMHGKKVMHSIWGMGQMMYTKLVIVVDEETDPYDLKAVAEKVLKHTTIHKDIVISEGPLDALDHASNTAFYGHRLGVDATKKWEAEGALEEGLANNSMEMKLDKLYEVCDEIKEVNFLTDHPSDNCVILTIKKSEPYDAKKVIEKVWEIEGMDAIKITIVVEEHVSAKDLSTVAWKVFNNIDAKRDLVYSDRRLGIDATKKWASEGHTRAWPDDIEMTEEIKDLVSKRWQDYGIKEA